MEVDRERNAEIQDSFLCKKDGTVPVQDFIEALDEKMQAKIVQIINLAAEKGAQLREPYSKHLEDGIFELRAKVGTDISRVLYFFVVGQKIVLTNGFIKKTQRTPPTEVERAKAYRADYLRRKEKEYHGGKRF